jgi:hypothetical protein
MIVSQGRAQLLTPSLTEPFFVIGQDAFPRPPAIPARRISRRVFNCFSIALCRKRFARLQNAR